MLKISASNNSCYQPVLVVVGYRGVGTRDQRAKRPYQKRGISPQKIRTTTARKVLQRPWFAQSLSQSLIRAKEIAKVAFERHSMVRS